MRSAHIHNNLFGYRCVASSAPLLDTHIPFLPLTVWLQVHCTLPTTPGRAPPLFTALCLPTGALRDLHHSGAHLPFHRHVSSYKCVARSPPLGRASPLPAASCPPTGSLHALHLSLTCISVSTARIRLQVLCPLSTSPLRIFIFNRLKPATGALPTIYLSLTCISFSTASSPAPGTLPAL